MANPNLNAATNVYAKSAFVALSATTPTAIIANSASSGVVALVESLIVANTDTATPVNVTVQVWDTDTVGTGNAFPVCFSVSVPAKASLVVLSKDAGVKLLENQSLSATASAANKLSVVAAWTEIS